MIPKGTPLVLTQPACGFSLTFWALRRRRAAPSVCAATGRGATHHGGHQQPAGGRQRRACALPPGSGAGLRHVLAGSRVLPAQ
eukprot:scaffold2324_cov266-Pinguiococcus_pyrenoidosus.AAC.19